MEFIVVSTNQRDVIGEAMKQKCWPEAKGKTNEPEVEKLMSSSLKRLASLAASVQTS